MDKPSSHSTSPSQSEQKSTEHSQNTYLLQNLLDYNQQRMEEFKKRPLFQLIKTGMLDNPQKRKRFLDSMQVWTEGNQTLLFARQGTCHDPYFSPVFLKHFQEEVGHDVLYSDRPDKSDFKDANMTAITTWFLHQMFVLDNLEKATIIHLVIESGSNEFHKQVQPFLEKHMSKTYFEAHKADSEHIAMGMNLLDGYSSKVYRRLRVVIEEAWDMLIAMVDRVAYLVQTSQEKR